MASKFRKNPLICLIVSLFNLITGRLKLSTQFINNIIKMNNGSEYKIFRHITTTLNLECPGIIFIVSFKFTHLSYRANKLASIIPMLMICGFPGFTIKIYAVNDSGYWQGMYQWQS